MDYARLIATMGSRSISVLLFLLMTVAACAAAVLSASGVSANETPKTGSAFRVRVRDGSTGQSVATARVRLTSRDNISSSFAADQAGRGEFARDDGYYSVEFSAPGYHPLKTYFWLGE